VAFTPVASGPAVIGLRRFGRPFQPTYLVLGFNGALDQASAENVLNYRIRRMNGHGRAIGRPIAVKLAVYDPTTHTVTLAFSRRLGLKARYQLTALASSSGITGSTGQPLNASPTQAAGEDFVTRLGFHVYAGPARHLPRVNPQS